MDGDIMKTITKSPLATTLVALFLLFLLFSGGAMTKGTMIGETSGYGLSGEGSWMWVPALFALALGAVLAWAIVKKAV